MDRVRLGVVGVGNIAPLNLAGYLEHERCDVVALCDPRSEVAERRAREWNVPSVYTNLGDLLADPDVDAVEILSPTHLHKEHVIAAARAGKPVSCQKPMANSVVGSLARRPRLDRGRGVATVVAQVAAGTAGRCRSPRARTRRCRRGGPGRAARPRVGGAIAAADLARLSVSSVSMSARQNPPEAEPIPPQEKEEGWSSRRIRATGRRRSGMPVRVRQVPEVQPCWRARSSRARGRRVGRSGCAVWLWGHPLLLGSCPGPGFRPLPANHDTSWTRPVPRQPTAPAGWARRVRPC